MIIMPILFLNLKDKNGNIFMDKTILLKRNFVSILQLLIKKEYTIKMISMQTQISEATCYRIIRKLEKSRLVYNSGIKIRCLSYSKTYRSTRGRYVIHIYDNKITIS